MFSKLSRSNRIKTTTGRNIRGNCIESLESRTMLAADLVLSVAGPTSVTAGTDATYVFTTVNNGKSTANGILYTPPVGYPTGCTQVSFTATSGPATTLKFGQSQTYTLVLAVDASVPSATVLSFPVEVTTRGDTTPGDNTVTVTTPVTASADLNLVISGPAEVTAGTEVTFTFSTFNAGPSTETTGLYTPPDDFPAGFAQLSYTLISGPGFALAPGDQDTYALVMSVSPTIANGTVASFPALLTGGVPDPVSTNNTGVVSTTVVTQTVEPVSVALNSSAFNSTSVLGAGVSFTATITPVTAGVTPTGMVSFTDNGVPLGTEPVGTDGTATLPATAALTGGDHTIVASYSGDDTYGATTRSITQVVTVPVPSTVIPTFGKVVLPTAVVSGAKFNASLPLTLTNNGSKQSGIFTVTLYADSGTTLDGNQVQLGNPTLKRETLLTDRHAPLPFRLTTLPATLASGTYHILAKMTDANGLSNVVATTQTITTSAPFISLVATSSAVTPAALTVNKSGSITITVTNNGNIAATGPLTITVAPSTDGTSPIASITLASLSQPHATIKNGKATKYTLHFKDTAAFATGTYFPYVTVALDGNSATVVGTEAFTLS